MKKLMLLFPGLLVGLFLLSGCRGDCVTEHEVQNIPLRVNLESNFDNDQVRVEIDQEVAFSKRVTTNHVLGLADGFALEKPSGRHTIRVTVNDVVQAEETFQLEKALYIAVRYGGEFGTQGGISFVFSDEPFMYD